MFVVYAVINVTEFNFNEKGYLLDLIYTNKYYGIITTVVLTATEVRAKYSQCHIRCVMQQDESFLLCRNSAAFLAKSFLEPIPKSAFMCSRRILSLKSHLNVALNTMWTGQVDYGHYIRPLFTSVLSLLHSSDNGFLGISPWKPRGKNMKFSQNLN